ncbi:MAG: pyridoxal 5'-phosphate synthase glutaminase subunit PdxT [Nitrososphaerales archaeon]|nr:pyridoxal 5'-phosphate synthase glutaminase subunit PdxT [Nitrososphaerales archaeon]
MAPLRIGVLALQGDVSEHTDMVNLALKRMGLEGEAIKIKKKEQIDEIHGLIIPGGESTTMGRVSELYGLIKSIKDAALAGMPMLGTCAGLILMAKKVQDAKMGETKQPTLGLLEVEVVRNAFGRQRESFETNVKIPKIGKKPFPGVFIRAPIIGSILSNDVEVLAHHDDKIVTVQQDGLIGIAFHPELADDTRLHELFIELILKSTFKNRFSKEDA